MSHKDPNPASSNPPELQGPSGDTPLLGVRRNYKDRVFRDLFGSEFGRRNAMELYNALGGGPVSDPAELQVLTVDNALYMGWRDDVSFVVGDDLVLWEHQSTHNPNMPLRGLGYFAQLYGKIVDKQGEDLYGPEALKLPTPRFIVFYAGEQNRPEREEMLLSSLFVSGPGDIEVKVTVLNVNKGNNEGIMSACKALRDYSILLDLIRRNRALGWRIDAAVEAAVQWCIDNDVLADYLKARRAEVCAMLIDEYEDARQMQRLYTSIERNWERWRKEGLAEGREKGLEEGRAKGLEEGRAKGLEEGRAEGQIGALSSLVKKGIISVQDAASEAGLAEEEFIDAAEKAGCPLPR